jgi:hypothetical protein
MQLALSLHRECSNGWAAALPGAQSAVLVCTQTAAVFELQLSQLATPFID